MVMSNIKKGLLVLFILWLATLSYIWLPGLIPDFLHLRGKLFSQKEKNLKDGINRFFGDRGRDSTNTSHAHRVVGGQQEAEMVHVAISSENSRMGGMIAVINSIVSNSRDPSNILFHLVTDSESSQHLKSWLAQTKLKTINYEIIEFPLDWVAEKIGFRGTRTELANPMNYARYYLPRLLPNIEGRIVYLDDDVIVQGDVSKLYNTKLRAGTLAAFAEDCQGLNKRVNFMQNVYADYFDLKNKHFQELKIKPSTCAFNAGVFVANLTLWRKHNVTQQLEHWLLLNSKEELYGNEKAGGGAQPPMMLVFHNKYTSLDPMWNVHFVGWNRKTSHNRQFVQKASLVHWSGPYKPWGRSAAFQDLWDMYFLPDPAQHFLPVRKGVL